MEPGYREGYKVVRRVSATDRAGFKPATLNALQAVRYRVGEYTMQTDYDHAGPFAVFDHWGAANRWANDLILWRLCGPNPHYAILRVEYLPSSNKKLWKIGSSKPLRNASITSGLQIVGRLIIKFAAFPRGTKFARVVIPREAMEVKEDER